MDEKTVIAGQPSPTSKEPQQQASARALEGTTPPAGPNPEADSNATIVSPVKPAALQASRKKGKAEEPQKAARSGKAGAPAARDAAKGGDGAPKASAPSPRPAGALVYVSIAAALLFLGLGSAVTTIYLLSPARNAVPQTVVAEADLQADLVPVEGEDNEAEDEALIRAAIKPRIIDLSGDPLVLPQLASAPRQLLKLASDAQRQAAGSLGVKGDVFRMQDVLDLPTPESQIASLGSQDDVAAAQDAPLDTPADDGDGTVGSSVVVASGPAPADKVSNFAQTAKAAISLTDALKGLGLDPEKAGAAASAFMSYYGLSGLQSNDRYAVRAAPVEGDPNRMQPVQVSVYSKSALVGSVALDDDGTYARAEDPWFQRDPFAAPLDPVQVAPEDQPRLLDAIYVTALRNRLPAPVIGEAIMLLSRSQDLEQKVQPGDTIALIYSPVARDAKQGLGRIVFVSIRRRSGNLDCYVMQSRPDSPFECVSSSGQGSVPDGGGMVTPVKGVVVAKFGPQGADSADAAQMNYGIDWTAPAGSPVVAAYAGQVTAIGPESGFGTVVRLSHDGGKTSMYGYLVRTQPGLSVGASVQAGQVIGFVGTPPSSRDPRLHFEVRNNGVAVDPAGDAQASASADAGASGSGSPVDQFVGRIIHIESGNNCGAANPKSTAVGLGQFIASTWMTTIKLHRPDLLVGRSREEVLAMRTNCDLSRAMTTAFTRDNAAVVRQAGHPVTPGNLYLAHFLGVGGAVKALGGSRDRLISDVFGEAHVRANPFEAGKTLGYLIEWAARKMGAAPSGGSTPSQGSGTTTVASNSEPLAKFAADPALAALKTAVGTLLQ